MNQQPRSSGGHAAQNDFRGSLYARLGLNTSASDQDVESAHRELLAFLATAPVQMRTWVSAQAMDVDEAFALLSIPAAELDAMALLESAQIPLSAPALNSALNSIPNLSRARFIRGGLLLLIAAIIFGVYQIGSAKVPGASSAKSDQSSASTGPGAATATIDQTRVPALMEKISANPKDIASLQALGDIYFGATEYKTAATWETKILEVDPKNKTALLALGAARFNLGNNSEAEKAWLKAAALYPNLVEVHYDLGFLYLSQTPPNNAKVITEWNKVIKIDPNSSVAKTVATHLKGLQSTSPTPSTTPSTK